MRKLIEYIWPLTYLRTGLILLLGLTANIALPLQSSAKGSYVPLPNLPFVFISPEQDTEIPEISDSLFDANARGITFDLARTNLRTTEPFIDTYQEQIVPLLKKEGLVLRKIVIRGAASPEGPYALNCWLGGERTHRLIEFLCDQLGTPADSLHIESDYVCEDYQHLATLMRQNNDAEADTVQAIWLNNAGNELKCKRALQRLNGGRTWQRLKKEYFPQLRQSRVMMWFGTPVKELAQHADTVTVLKTDSVAEQLPLPADTTMAVPYSTDKKPRLPLIAIRTNLIHDFFYMPNFGRAWGGNVQLEYFPRKGHFTYNIGFTFINHRHWEDYKFFQIRDLSWSCAVTSRRVILTAGRTWGLMSMVSCTASVSAARRAGKVKAVARASRAVIRSS